MFWGSDPTGGVFVQRLLHLGFVIGVMQGGFGSDVAREHGVERRLVMPFGVVRRQRADAIGVHALLQAQPDPFCAMETCWLRHIDADHRDVVARLASRLPGPLRRGRVRPLGLDRYGVRLRVEGDDGDHDIRLPFARPVDDVQGLSQAIRILMGCPFVNGLRPRHT